MTFLNVHTDYQTELERNLEDNNGSYRTKNLNTENKYSTHTNASKTTRVLFPLILKTLGSFREL